MRSRSLLLLTVTIGLALPIDLAARTDALDDPATTTVLEMVAAKQTDEEILEHIDELAPFPEFSGQDLAELKRRGVSDRILLHMLQLTDDGAQARPASPASSRESTSTLASPDAGGVVRVVIDCPFAVSFVEVALDGKVMNARGKLWQDSVGAGEHLDTPPDVIDQEPAVLLESPVSPGRHTAAVGFAVTEVRRDPSEAWGQEPGEHYETRGIRATPSFLPGQAPGGNPGAECTVKAGQLCEIVVTPQHTTSALLRGASVYNVRYQVSVVDGR